MSRRAARAGLWLAVAALVFLAGRYLAYALAPRPTLEAARLGRETGGARPLELALALLGAAVALAATALAVATAAARQRHTLAGAPLRPPPPPAFRIALTAVALWAATSLAFALVESRIHAAAGLRMSPLHCLVGPVHRDVLPIFAALSLLAAAFTAAGEYLVEWLRGAIELLRRAPAPPWSAPPARPPSFVQLVTAAARPRAHGSRGPPRPLLVP